MTHLQLTMSKSQLATVVSTGLALRPDPLVLRFTADSLRVSMVDPGEVVMMVFHLMENQFEFYEVELAEGKDEIEICVDVQKLADAAKIMNKDSVDVSFNGKDPILTLRSGRVKRTVPTYMPEKPYRRDLPHPPLPTSFKLVANDAKAAFKMAETLDDTIQVQMQNGALTIRSGEHYETVEVSYEKDECESSGSDSSALYTSSFIASMLSGVSGGEMVHFEFGTNKPLFVNYSNSSGDYAAIAAPRVEPSDD